MRHGLARDVGVAPTMERPSRAWPAWSEAQGRRQLAGGGTNSVTNSKRTSDLPSARSHTEVQPS